MGTITVDTVTIDDDDEIGNFYFSSASYTVGEAAGFASITVYRSLFCSTDHFGTATVHYSASDGTANSPADYTLTPGILSFAASVTAVSFSVPIVDDLIGEPTEYFNLALSSATNGASINGWISGPSVSVSIVDNDDGGSFGYGQSTYTYSEIYGATISVTRTPTLGGGVILGPEASAEIAGRGGIGNARGSEGVEEDFVLAPQFEILQASAVAQRVIGQVEDVIGCVVGKVKLEQMEPFVDGLDEPAEGAKR